LILPLYLMTLGFTGAFALSGRMTSPVIMSIPIGIAVVFQIVSRKMNHVKLGPRFFLSAVFFTIVLVSLLVQTFQRTPDDRGFSHAASNFFVPILYWGAFESYIRHRRVSVRRIFKLITLGALFVSVFMIFEFIAQNLLDLSADDLIPRPSLTRYDALYTYGSSGLFRARGLASESGHAALYLLIFAPVVFYYFATYVRSRRKAILALMTHSDMLVGFQEVFSRLQLADRTAGSRVDRWQHAITIFNQKPLWGGGPGIAVVRTRDWQREPLFGGLGRDWACWGVGIHAHTGLVVRDNHSPVQCTARPAEQLHPSGRGADAIWGDEVKAAS